jgi:purine nucleosidase|tara:strand:+ start:486 stop:1472 length:987 start_codon:yes stop_codon:yes gene_type:complete
LKKFIIDADTGSDDAVAILLALQDPSVEILGISVVSGNVPLRQGIKNTISTIDMTEKKVKVYAGADKPISREYEEIYDLENFMKHVKSLKPSSASGQCVHGIDGMGDIGTKPSIEVYEQKNAVDFITDAVNENPNEITLVTLGPLTNIALAIQKDSSITEKIKHCYVMGGTSDGTGNVTAAAEYNIWVDPEAAKICFDSGMNITMVGWDNSYKYAMLKEQEIEDLRSLNSKLADFSIDIQKTLIDLTFSTYGFHGFDLPDPITMAIALDNSIIEDAEQLHVIIDVRDGITRGQTIVDYFNVEKKTQNIRVVRKSDKDKFMNLLKKSLK